MLILLKEICHDLFSKAAFRERTSALLHHFILVLRLMNDAIALITRSPNTAKVFFVLVFYKILRYFLTFAFYVKLTLKMDRKTRVLFKKFSNYVRE